MTGGNLCIRLMIQKIDIGVSGTVYPVNTKVVNIFA